MLAWASETADAAVAIVDDCTAALKDSKPSADDPVRTGRVLRAVVALAAATKAVRALVLAETTGAGGKVAAPQQEDEMDHCDDSPETVQRLRDELESRLRRLRSVLESKGLGVEPRPWPPARAACEPVRPS